MLSRFFLSLGTVSARDLVFYFPSYAIFLQKRDIFVRACVRFLRYSMLLTGAPLARRCFLPACPSSAAALGPKTAAAAFLAVFRPCWPRPRVFSTEIPFVVSSPMMTSRLVTSPLWAAKRSLSAQAAAATKAVGGGSNEATVRNQRKTVQV